jgi:hypothetical protein
VNEIREIRGWIIEHCDWDENRFDIKIHSSGSIMDVWFEDEKDASFFALRWL